MVADSFVAIAALSGLLWMTGGAIWALGYQFCWRKATRQKVQMPNTVPASVIIASHNNRDYLEICLKAICRQTHLNFECIIVNDRSTDNTSLLIEQFENQDRRIRSITISEVPLGWSPKKWAITKGVESAKYNNLLFTDADCEPHPEWIMWMTGILKEGYDVVIGLGSYKAIPGSLLNLFIRYENAWHSLQMLSAVGYSSPFFATGRSLAYTRNLFNSISGLSAHKELLSGDDDLFLHQLPKSVRVFAAPTPGLSSSSFPAKSFIQYFRQRSRHITTASYYVPKWKYALGFWGIVELISYPSLIFCFIFTSQFISHQAVVGIPWFLAIFTFSIQRLIINTGVHFVALGQSPVLIFYILSPVLELLHWAFTVALALSLPFKKKSW